MRDTERKEQDTVNFEPDDYEFEVYWSEEDGVFVAKCLDFDLVGGDGKTPGEALEMGKESLRLVLEDYAESGDCPPPQGKHPPQN